MPVKQSYIIVLSFSNFSIMWLLEMAFAAEKPTKPVFEDAYNSLFPGTIA